MSSRSGLPDRAAWGRAGISRKAGAWLLLALCFLLATGCRKRANLNTIVLPPPVHSPAPEPAPPADQPESPTPAPPEDLPVPVAAPAWLEADEQYWQFDLAAACRSYRELSAKGSAQWPGEVALRAFIACAMGSSEERLQAGQWLDQLAAVEDSSSELSVTPPILKLILEKLQLQSQTIKERDLKLEQLNRELENLKKIDSRRRRP